MTSRTFQTITVETDTRGVARLTLNRPAKHNALNGQLIDELKQAADLLASDDSVRVAVLTGEGKSFCAGGDFNWFKGNAAADRATRIRESSKLAHMLNALNGLPKPLIGRIQGPAYGGGVGMISVCDIAVGVDTARFGLTEVRLGLIPANISPHVVARIGAANARATMLSGALFSAANAEKIGLLNETVTPDDLDARIDSIIADHLEAALGAVGETKRLIAYVASHSITDNMIYTADRLADAWETDEGSTGINSFLGKTLPPWRTGK
jgi:methylglutaconyl-CoA hydratase